MKASAIDSARARCCGVLPLKPQGRHSAPNWSYCECSLWEPSCLERVKFLPCSSCLFRENRAREHTRVWKWFSEARPSDCRGLWGAGNPLLQLAQDTGVPVILDKGVTLERKKSPSSVLGQHSPPSSPASTKKLSLIFDFSGEFWAFFSAIPAVPSGA